MLKSLLMFLSFSVLASTAAQAQELNFTDGRSPYEVLKEFYEQAPSAASPSQFKTIEDLYQDRRAGHVILTRFFGGRTDEAFMITPELSTNEVAVWQGNYLLNSRRRFIIQAGRPAQEAEQGKGPLFPPKPAVPAEGDVCGEVSLLWPALELGLYPEASKDNCKSILPGHADKNPWVVNTAQTPRDLIVEVGYKNTKGEIEKRTTIFYRRSGDLIAMKIVAEKFAPAHSTIEAYNYAFKK